MLPENCRPTKVFTRRFTLFLALLLVGCTTTSNPVYQRIAQLHLGMTLEEVNDLLGKPRKSNNVGALTVYEYQFDRPVALHNVGPPTLSYYVIVDREDRVSSFGPN